MLEHKNNALIKDDLEIYSLLKKVQKSKQLISLSFDSLPNQSLTSLIEVHYDSKVLVFDEPNPQLTSKLIVSKHEAEFSLTLEKLPVKFNAKFILNKKDNDFNDLYTPFPSKIYYPQNRNYHRFRTEFIEGIKAVIFLSPTKQLPCQLINISLRGLCIRLPYSFASIFQLNQSIDDIYIQLPNQKGFSISAKIQNTQIEAGYTHIVLGLQIKEQQSSIEKTIQQFIFRTENI